jgi:hypothetical protein
MARFAKLPSPVVIKERQTPKPERKLLQHDGDCVFGSAKRATPRDILGCAAPNA